MKMQYVSTDGYNYFFKVGWFDEGKELPGMPLPCAVADLVYPEFIEDGEYIGEWESPTNLYFVGCSLFPLVTDISTIFSIYTSLSEKLGFLFITEVQLVYQAVPDMSELPTAYYDAFGASEPDGNGWNVMLPLDDIDDWSPDDGDSPCTTPMEFYNKNYSISSGLTEELEFLVPEEEPILEAEPSYTTVEDWGNIEIHRKYYEPSVTLYTVEDTPLGGVWEFDFPGNPSSGMIWAKLGIPCDSDLRVYIFNTPEEPTIVTPVFSVPLVIPLLNSFLQPLLSNISSSGKAWLPFSNMKLAATHYHGIADTSGWFGDSEGHFGAI
jgi:hypothetical protein